MDMQLDEWGYQQENEVSPEWHPHAHRYSGNADEAQDEVPPKKLLVADLESTIIENECLDDLAKYAANNIECEKEMAAITARAMAGELGFEAALSERVEMLAGLPVEVLQKVYDNITFTSGAEILVAKLKEQGHFAVLVSGGFEYFVQRIAGRLGFDDYRCNDLEIKDGKLTGKIIPPILGVEAKADAAKFFQNKFGVTAKDIIAVGDGANDVAMLKYAGLGVSCYGKPVAEAAANIQIREGEDLTKILRVLGVDILAAAA